MAKITLKNYEELIISDEVAEYVTKDLDEKRTKAEFPLNHYPLAITHAEGLWSGTLNDIGSISSSSKRTTRTKWFESTEDISRFHNTHGYGQFQNKYEQGYGLVDVKNQLSVKIGKTKLEVIHNQKKLVMLQWKDKSKEKAWSDLWEVYEKNLDSFNELVEPNKRICKITE